MKKITHYLMGLALIALALFTGVNANAQSFGQLGNTLFSVPAQASYTNSGVTTAYAIVPQGAGQPSVTYVQYYTDATNVGVRATIATKTNTMVNIATNVASTIIMVNGNGTEFAANDVCILAFGPNSATNSYQRVTVSSVTTTNITLAAATTYPTKVGDILWRCATNVVSVQQFSGAVAQTGLPPTLSNGGGSVFNGPANRPMLIECVGNTNASLYNVSGRYVGQNQ